METLNNKIEEKKDDHLDAKQEKFFEVLAEKNLEGTTSKTSI